MFDIKKMYHVSHDLLNNCVSMSDETMNQIIRCWCLVLD